MMRWLVAGVVEAAAEAEVGGRSRVEVVEVAIRFQEEEEELADPTQGLHLLTIVPQR